MTYIIEYLLDYLQAVEPDALTTADGITVVVDDELDSMGFNRVSISGPTREAVVEYVRANWGDDDRDWFAEWVENRVVMTRRSWQHCVERALQDHLDHGKTLREITPDNFDLAYRTFPAAPARAAFYLIAGRLQEVAR